MQVEEHEILQESAKKIRRRKKNLYNSILQQIEFYFSDANLRKDRFFSQLIGENPYVELSTFLKFFKISALTNKIEEIATALEKSKILQLSEDKLKVCRMTPIKEKINEDECTIYVERLPEDTQHDWLKEIFSSFGKVDYVSLPKYKHNKRHKGFAFIEFSEADSAQKALTYFESIGFKLPTQMPPNQLASILTFEPDNLQDFNQKHEQIIVPIQQEPEIVIVKEDNNRKKRKLSSSEDNEMVKKEKLEEHEEVNEENEENNEDDTQDKKKRKRKKNKKGAIDFRQIGLQVLSK